MTVSVPPTRAYVYSTGNLAGVATASNFMALTNPAGSGKVLRLAGVFISNLLVGASTTSSSMRGVRVSAVSGGTDESANIAKFKTTDPDPVGEVRISGVTMTLGKQLFNSPPHIAAAAASEGFVHQVPIPFPFLLLPEEGIGLRTNSGDTDQRWNLSIVWTELDP
jgi:hypothetical protein